MVTICHNMQRVTCVIMMLSLHTNRFWPPRKSRLSVDKQGIRKAETFYPQLLIAGLITLRVLQLEGNLGSASSSLPTVAPENTLGGVALAQPRSFGIFRLCTCVCIWGQQHALRSLELRHDSNEGATRSPAHSKAVHFKRKCPPDTSLTCTWGSMVRRETPLKLPWLGPPHRGMMEEQGQDIQTPTESCLLSPTILSALFNHPRQSAGKRGLPSTGYLFLRIKPLLPTQFLLGNLTPYTFDWSSDCCSNCAQNEHIHCYPGPALPGKNSTALHCEIHRIANENLLGTFAITLSIY